MNDIPTLESSFDLARFNLSRNLSLLTTVLLLTIGVIYLIEDDVTAYLITSGGIIAFISYLMVVKTQSFRMPTIICLILLSLLNIANLTVASNFHHIGDYFWAIAVTTTAYFILGKHWGIALTIFNLSTIFTMFFLIRNGYFVQIEKPYTDYSQINFFINLCIGGTIYSFLIIEFLKQNRDVAKKYMQANNDLKVLNAEKTIMLKEIHHRVKNNLQIVTSLLRLQKAESENPVLNSEFTQAIDRISAIAKIHDKMYNNESLTRISLKNYLEELTDDLLDTHTLRTEFRREITTNIESIPPKHLVPIALLFNELITNSIKHAFSKQPNPQIKIEAHVNTFNTVTMKYADNGTWVKASEAEKESSIGLELIDSFVAQLDGTYKIDKTEQGTNYTFSFTIMD